MDEQETQLRQIFTEALALPASEWPSLLDRRCGTQGLRARVQALLDHHVRSDEFLSRPAMQTYPEVAGAIGGQIAEFRVIRELGRGGMGVVYLAEDTVLKRTVALKVLPPQPDIDAAPANRFRKEAQAIARLSHPGIVQIYRSGEERGLSYIVMEYVEGETLRSWATGRTDPKSTPPPARSKQGSESAERRSRHCNKEYIVQCARLLSEVADALDHAHRQGVIHRDIKPSNILIDRDGRARLTDFGVARITSEHTLSKAGDIAGSYPYMSPEQARVQQVEVDHRSDIFSLGVVLYELLTGTRPFDGATPQDILKALIESQPVSVRRLNSAVPADLVTICHKALEKLPQDRYQTAAHVAADLRCFVDQRPILARPASTSRRVRAWVRRHERAVLTWSLVLCVCAILGVGALYIGSQHSRLGRLVVSEAHAGARVSATRYSATLAAESTDDLGTAPLSTNLRPGLYRITITQPDGQRLEASSLVEAGGRDDLEVRRPTPETVQSLTVIPSGDYTLGETASDYSLTKRRRVALNSFLIAPTEVSNREYREFVLATRGRSPRTWATPYSSADDDLPVSDVTWDEANRYCRWRGVRLPTPDEWEAAALGPGGSSYPWGNEPHPSVHREDFEDDLAGYRASARAVRSQSEFATPLGIMHMLTNVQEYTEGYAPDRGGGIVVKGRSWANPAFRRSSQVYVLSGRSLRAADRGFRIAFSNSLKGPQE